MATHHFLPMKMSFFFITGRFYGHHCCEIAPGPLVEELCSPLDPPALRLDCRSKGMGLFGTLRTLQRVIAMASFMAPC